MSDEPIPLNLGPGPIERAQSPDYHDKSETASETPNWLASVAGKKVAWAISKLIVAKASTPAAVALWDAFTGVLKPLGITIQIDANLLTTALPGVVFAILVAGHDALKVKFPGFKWL